MGMFFRQILIITGRAEITEPRERETRSDLTERVPTNPTCTGDTVTVLQLAQTLHPNIRTVSVRQIICI